MEQIKLGDDFVLKMNQKVQDAFDECYQVLHKHCDEVLLPEMSEAGKGRVRYLYISRVINMMFAHNFSVVTQSTKHVEESQQKLIETGE